MAYRFYISEVCRNIPRQKFMKKSFHDIIKPKKVDNRSGDEIAQDIITKAGIKLK